MKFIICYGCDGIGTEKLAVEAESIEIALEYAYASAKDYRSSYEGLHGVLDFAEFCEDEDYEMDDMEAVEAFEEFVENELEYWVEDFDEDNEEHDWILADCNEEFFQI